MLIARQLVAMFLVCLPTLPLNGQTTSQTSSATQPVSLLQQSLAALVGDANISEVTLTGTARRIVGSSDETGTVVVQALSGGSCKLQLTLPSGNFSETRLVADSGLSGNWSGPDGVAHSAAYHNLVTDSGLVPFFTLASSVSNTNRVVTLIGQEIRNGQSVIHLTASQQFPSLTGDAAAFMQRLSQVASGG